MMKRVIDLFCGAGGASVGLNLSGFNDIFGIDNVLQPEYPFSFILGNVFEQPIDFYKSANLIWASPPCQAYTFASKKHRNLGKNYPDLIKRTRKLLLRIKKPYVIENVCSAPIRKDLILNGSMFGLPIIRARAFEIHGFKIAPPALYKEVKKGTVKNGDFITVAGHGGDGTASLSSWQKAMGIDWINDKKMLAEAVPPAYAKYIGEQALKTSEANNER